MTIKYKLNLITAIVVSFALIIITIATFKAIDDKENISRSQNLNTLSQKLSLVIHETQKERGASAGFIGSLGKKFGNILPNQRVATTKEYENLKAYIDTLDLNSFPKELKDEISAFNGDMAKIEQVRSKVTELSITTKEAVSYYTAMNSKILTIVSLSAK